MSNSLIHSMTITYFDGGAEDWIWDKVCDFQNVKNKGKNGKNLFRDFWLTSSRSYIDWSAVTVSWDDFKQKKKMKKL